MPDTFYEPLSYLDSSFLALETRTTHMHVAAVALFEAGPLQRENGGIDIARIRQHIGSKLQYIPRYRQRLGYVPYNRSPVWIDDDTFNFDYHVRHTSLPRPGTDQQLRNLAGRIVSQQLDRSKPLWELWVVEGVEDDRFAIIAKIHHCMIDGIAGVDLTTILLNVLPTSEIEDTPEWHPRPAPNGTQLAVAEIARTARRTIDHLGSVGEVVREGRQLLESASRRISAVRNSLESGWLTPTGRTPLNPDIGPNRRFDSTEIPLDEVKAVKNALGGSLNDVILATVAGAIRHFLEVERNFSTAGIEFRVMAPVSVRKSDHRGQLGNQVAMWLVTLPVDEPDPVERLRKIAAETLHLKRSDQALGAATLVDLSRGTPLPLLSLANRLVGSAVRPFNMTVTNIPGPQFPMYLLEAKMLANYPIVPLWQQHGVGIALFSYDGRLLWGIHADYDTLPDSADFVSSIHHSFELLRTAAAATA
ncbi:MAG TPA: wax ester/triacylglycerol synthase family O-acyltransferase [Acidimicrobiia bacterium]|nr:wax ester/triacylglycerol synthase family O-acyltransferase [Acidimicrobiia bacterium]